jgi:hypothetical protein
MKLYNLFEEIILERLITESVNTNQIINAIDGEYSNNGKKFIRRYKIHYDGDDVKDEFGHVTRKGKGWRNIVVHAYGRLKNGGREVIRAYQVYGDSLRTEQNPEGWKLFRVDRITHWEPTNLKYWGPIEIAGQPTNMNGDDSMMGSVEAGTIKIVDFTPKDGGESGETDQNTQNTKYFDTKANIYNYDNAEKTADEPETNNRVEPNNIPKFDEPETDNEEGVGFDDERIKNVIDKDSEIDNEENGYSEEDIEDDDEIKDF